ncbi:MAG: AEC family transporter [Clostridia bacterium]|nr:AEC family transporter [Clostridia bacterium]
MTEVLIVLTQTAVLAVLLIPGFIFGKLKISGEGFTKGLADFILYVAQPAMLLSPYIRSFDSRILANMGVTALFSFVCHGLFMIPAYVFFSGKRFDGNVKGRVYRFAVIFGNCGYMGIPLIRNILGDEATIYATVFNIGFQVFLWTVGCFIATGDRKYMSVRKLVLNPSVITIFVCILVFLLPVDKYVPAVFTDVIDLLKETVVPLSMFVVGFQMARNSFSGFFKDGNVWLAAALRLISCPLLAFAVLYPVNLIFPMDKALLTVILIVSGTPCATVTSIFAEKFGFDKQTAGRLIPLSTILSVATLPLIPLLVKLFP